MVHLVQYVAPWRRNMAARHPHILRTTCTATALLVLLAVWILLLSGCATKPIHQPHTIAKKHDHDCVYSRKHISSTGTIIPSAYECASAPRHYAGTRCAWISPYYRSDGTYIPAHTRCSAIPKYVAKPQKARQINNIQSRPISTAKYQKPTPQETPRINDATPKDVQVHQITFPSQITQTDSQFATYNTQTTPSHFSTPYIKAAHTGSHEISGGCHWVRSYYRRDGTHVSGHKRCRYHSYTSIYPSIPFDSGYGKVYVRGYYRKNGTYVRPHTRSRARFR